MHLLLKATVPIGLAPGGVYPATTVTSGAVRSYRTLSPLPYEYGGLLSVALSLRSPSLAVNQHRISVEPGLSSPALCAAAVIQPSTRAQSTILRQLGQART